MIEVRNISDFNDYLESLLVQNESDDLEFKSAAGGFPGNFWDTYSAFANTDGGTIVLGVKEKNGKFFLDNLSPEQIEKYRKDFWNNVNNPSTISHNLMRKEDVIVGNYKGFGFMLFFVPRAPREVRPVYRTNEPYKGTYKRNYEGDYKCTEQEVRRMFADADDSRPVDSRILKNYTIEDIDKDALAGYRQLFKVSHPDHPWHTLSDIELLRMLGGYRRDRQTGEEGFTVAGLLMFGKTQAITDVECTPHFFPDYQEIENPKDRWINRIYPDGNWESNLFQFYRRVLPILQGFLPKPFRLEGNQRINDTPAHVAVREALTNLCIHADHTENATLNVYKYSNKIVFSNPGTMLISPAQYYKGGESICRNKYLQTMFMFLGSSEKAGSGTDKILHGWEKQNWKKPYIMERSRPNKVMLTMPLESLMDEHVIEALNLHFGKKIEGLSRQQLTALALAYSEEEITNERLQHVLDMHRADITTMLSDMCTQQLLESYGYGRGTKYHVYGLNIGLPKNNIGLNASSIGLQDSNTGLGNSSIGLKKKRYSKEEIKKNILDVCQDWRTAEEIATAVGRKVLYIRDIVLPQLSDVIEKMYDVPHHPRQKYRARKKDD